MIAKEVMTEIDRVIKSVWVKDIRRDYMNGTLLYEDSLKCALNYHLRKRLDKLFRDNHLRLYGEYTFPGLKFRADLVIAEIDEAWDISRSLKESVTDIAAIIELKYTNGAESSTDGWIRNDLQKFKRNFQTGGYDCQFYFGVIYEVECSSLSWVDGRSVACGTWGYGRVTELDAGYINGTMMFEVNSHNGMNE